MIVMAGGAGIVLRIIAALSVILATYDPDGRWKMPILVILGFALVAAAPGLGVYLWRHHEPRTQEWRGSKTSGPENAM